MRSICAATSSSLSSLCVVNVCATIIVLLLPNWLVICLPIVLANKRASVCVCVCVSVRAMHQTMCINYFIIAITIGSVSAPSQLMLIKSKQITVLLHKRITRQSQSGTYS